MKEVVIICGGLASRLGSLTQDIPKSMVQIDSKPFIYYQLRLLEKNKIDHVVLCLGHFGEQVEEYLEAHDFDLNIEFSYDGETKRGTGGAIKNALPLLNRKFMVIYGDSYLDFDYNKLFDKFEKHNNPSIMTIYRNENNFDKSNVKSLRDTFYYNPLGQGRAYEYIDYGANMFNKSCFNESMTYDFDTFELYQLQLSLQDEKQLDFYMMKHRFYEIGSVAGIEDFKRYVEEHGDLF
jgi:NDP-sugar pyrophosphorylase family protein